MIYAPAEAVKNISIAAEKINKKKQEVFLLFFFCINADLCHKECSYSYIASL